MTSEHDELITINLDEMTLGELEQIEEYTGQPIASLNAENLPAKALTAIVLVMKRRTDPDFTFEQARAVRMEERAEGPPDPAPSIPPGAGGRGCWTGSRGRKEVRGGRRGPARPVPWSACDMEGASLSSGWLVRPRELFGPSITSSLPWWFTIGSWGDEITR